MARIRDSSGLEIVKVSLLRKFVHPGEQISGYLDFRGSSVAAAAAFETNSNILSSESTNQDSTKDFIDISQAVLDPYICSQYSVSLVSVEKVADGCEKAESYDSAKSSLGSGDLQSPISNVTSLNNSLEQINILAKTPRSPKKRIPNHITTENEVIHSTFADIVVASDMVGFKLPYPEETAAPTFTTHIGSTFV